jgi:hypothetical protein
VIALICFLRKHLFLPAFLEQGIRNKDERQEIRNQKNTEEYPSFDLRALSQKSKKNKC